MIPAAEFDVVGLPGPQGSKTTMPNGAMVEGSSTTGRARTKAWRLAVATVACVEWCDREPLSGPVAVWIIFRLPMPASRPARVRKARVEWHSVKPDKDKLLRATLDGLKAAGVFTDDARVCSFRVDAIEVAGWTGATITIGTPLPVTTRPELEP